MFQTLNKIINVSILVLIVIILFSSFNSLTSSYSIEYNDSSSTYINDLIIRNNIRLNNKKYIRNVYMCRLLPSGYSYTINYIDNNNHKQSITIERKSETIFKDYIIEYGENITNKYINLCKICFCILFLIIFLKIVYLKGH